VDQGPGAIGTPGGRGHVAGGAPGAVVGAAGTSRASGRRAPGATGAPGERPPGPPRGARSDARRSGFGPRTRRGDGERSPHVRLDTSTSLSPAGAPDSIRDRPIAAA